MNTSYPMLKKYLISDLPKMGELLPYLRKLDISRWYTNFGHLSAEFEHRVRHTLSMVDKNPTYGAIQATTMVTGYHALEVGLRLMKLAKGGKVLIPAVTFPACALAAQYAGYEAVLADIDEKSWTLTPVIARKVAAKTKIAAVMPVAIYGVPIPVGEWDKFTKDTGIPVIIDAAAAYETQQIPRYGLVIHSLHATKPFGVGEGGLLIGRNAKLIRDARIYSNFGTYDRIAKVEGSNTKMSEYHAAVGIAQCKRWSSIKKNRKHVFELYKKHLRPLMDKLSFQPGIENAVVSTLMVRLKKPLAAKLLAYGTQNNICFHKMYLPPLYHHPYLNNLAVANTDGVVINGSSSLKKKANQAQNCENLHAHCVGLPFHPFLREQDIVHVVDALKKLLKSK